MGTSSQISISSDRMWVDRLIYLGKCYYFSRYMISTKNRLHFLDGIRGIASSIVVITHFFAAFFPYSIYGLTVGLTGVQHNALEDWLLYTPLRIVVSGKFPVIIFFLMSGYVLSCKHLNNNRDRRAILGDGIKRYVRLGIPLFVSCSLSFLLYFSGLYTHQTLGGLTGSQWLSGYTMSEDGKFITFLSTMILRLFKHADAYRTHLTSLGSLN
jgi:peptidoglycan/LPS O-acetylase OafA/YrhL